MEKPLALLMNHRLLMSLILLCCRPLFGYESTGSCENKRTEPGRSKLFLNEPVCLIDTNVKNFLGSGPSWDKWSLWIRGGGTDPGFDVLAPEARSWRLGGLSVVWHLCGLAPSCPPVFTAYFWLTGYGCSLLMISRCSFVRHRFELFVPLCQFTHWARCDVWH